MANGRDGLDRRQKAMNICSSVMHVVTRCLSDDSEVEGQSLVEYSLIFVLMIIVCFSVLATLSNTVNVKLWQVVQAMP